VHPIVLKPGWDTILFAVPFIGLMLVVLFRLDHMFSQPKQRSKPRRPPSGLDRHGQPVMTDPDGRPWRRKSRRK
jgi:hypothetical protein